MKKIYCEFCGKLQTEAEFLVGQCNDCDPFVEPEELEEVYGEAEYKDDKPKEKSPEEMTDEFWKWAF